MANVDPLGELDAPCPLHEPLPPAGPAARAASGAAGSRGRHAVGEDGPADRPRGHAHELEAHDDHAHDHDAHGHDAHDHDAHDHDAHRRHEGNHPAHDHDAGDRRADQGHASGRSSHGPAGHHHAHDLHAASTRRLGAALVLTASFMGVEAGVGWWSGSLSLVADAAHMFADAAALAMAIAAQRIAARPRTRAQTYGFRRAEVLAAFVNGVVLAGVAIAIVAEAVERLGEPRAVHGGALTATALAGLAVNLVAAFILSRGEGRNVNVRAALAHVLSDAAGSVGALSAGIAVAIWGVRWADAVASAFIAALVAWGAVRLVRETTHVLMQGAPPDVDCADVAATVRAVPGVLAMHDLHLWRVSDGLDVVTLHVEVEDEARGTEVAALVTGALRARFRDLQVTVQPEAKRAPRSPAAR